ncbi:MAG: threonine synthase [Bacteroidetes bacterium RBG_19FT_COMBO_42_10]|nr:MAG: threonine synthase [Bacteroidetes bacterium RBG_19FT_COMBO_42_10]
MTYYSTNLKAPEVSFREALLKGLPPDGGLYMPSYIPKITREELTGFVTLEYYELAFNVLRHLLFNEISNEDLKDICRDAYNFDVPVEKVYDRKYVLRLDQGPTASFKDFAARLMARLMYYFISRDNLRFTILTATSGDTGSAVASAFHGLRNINVIILFPAREVSDTQRKQMTTLHDNVNIICIDGKFDDCQELVKRAFLDPELSDIRLSSANSINIGRLLPQSVYYFYAWSKISVNTDDNIIFSVPSGNFGNLMGGIIAREMGLPVRKFIVATNSNNEVPEFLRTGNYKTISPSINCISSAMNVGHPSNLARIVAFYGGLMNESGSLLKTPDMERMRNDFFGISVSDEETRSSIAGCYKKYRMILEPHGAVAWKGMECYHEFSDDSGNQLFVALETAHPAKFRKEVESLPGLSLPSPDSLANIDSKIEKFTELENDYEKLRSFIREQG